MTTEKTHYRKAFDSPYLSSADIVEPTVLARWTTCSTQAAGGIDCFTPMAAWR